MVGGIDGVGTGTGMGTVGERVEAGEYTKVGPAGEVAVGSEASP